MVSRLGESAAQSHGRRRPLVQCKRSPSRRGCLCPRVGGLGGPFCRGCVCPAVGGCLWAFRRGWFCPAVWGGVRFLGGCTRTAVGCEAAKGKYLGNHGAVPPALLWEVEMDGSGTLALFFQNVELARPRGWGRGCSALALVSCCPAQGWPQAHGRRRGMSRREGPWGGSRTATASAAITAAWADSAMDLPAGHRNPARALLLCGCMAMAVNAGGVDAEFARRARHGGRDRAAAGRDDVWGGGGGGRPVGGWGIGRHARQPCH